MFREWIAGQDNLASAELDDTCMAVVVTGIETRITIYNRLKRCLVKPTTRRIPMWHWDPHPPPIDPFTNPLTPYNPRNPKFLFTPRDRRLTILNGPGPQE
jgi:hypothetical protein